VGTIPPTGQPTSPPTPAANVPASDELVNLRLGKPLSAVDVSEVLRADGAPIVVLVGAPKCGKTTLLASLHDAFQRRPFAGYLGAGSRTIIGFEERSFDSRFASGREKPVTPRTRHEEGILFYHMKLRKEDLRSPIKHLLLADMSGEHYENSLDSATVLRGLDVFRRADQFVHLVDGYRLTSSDWSAYTQANALMLMRRCFEEKMFDSDAKVDVLLTKWDLVLASVGEERGREILQSQERAFRNFEKRVGRLRVIPIASRPHYKSSLQPAYGLADLLRSWTEEPPRKSAPQERRLPVTELRIPFEEFALREAPHLYTRKSDD
jgi:hypothetical protein